MNAPDSKLHAPAQPQAELSDLLSDWLNTLGLRFRGSLRLAMAETKLAVTSFVLMIFLTVLAAGALMFAWMLLLAGMVQALSLAGLTLLAAIAIVAGLHVGLAWAFWRMANKLGQHMEFRATRELLGSRS